MPARHVESSSIGRSAMRKAFWRILPLILPAYLCAYIDRINVSFAAATMNADLGFSATIYGLGGGLFFLGYALFEIPSNLMLVRFGARKWIARIMITWSLLSMGMIFVHTPMQFYVVRFLLGVAEAGFYPGVITYFATWFPPCHRSRAVSRFYVATPLASIVMGSASGWLLSLDGHSGLLGWQWLFLVQGLPSVAVGLAVLWLLPDKPAAVAWLTQPEKDWIDAELTREQQRIGGPASQNILAAFRNPVVLVSGGIGVLLIGTITTFNLSAPILLEAKTGLDVAHVGYLVALGGLIGAAVILLLGSRADRNGDRLIYSCWCALIMAASIAVFLISSSALIVAMAYLGFATVCFAVPMLGSSNWADMLPARELAVGAAAINTISQTGAFAMPFAWGAAKDATGTFDTGLAALAVFALATAALTAMLRGMLRRNQVQRTAALA